MNLSSAYRTYLVMSAASPFLGSTIWVVGAVYYVLSVHMNPLQLVLVGTVLEVSYFLFQIPTGVFADTHSRRLSVVVGVTITGFCWLFQGLVPLFGAVLVAEAVRGFGEACIDGAESAWLSDEIGKEEFGRATLRGSQLAQIGGMAGTWAGVALASIHLFLPMAVGGALLLVLGCYLAVFMPEHNFRPAARLGLSRRAVMRNTAGTGLRVVRGTPVLIALLCAALIVGAHSEGYDRLWEAHFIKDFTLPRLDHLKPVVWFGIMSTGNGLVYMVAAEVLRRRLDTVNQVLLVRALFVMSAMSAASIIVFGLAGTFPLALAAFAAVSLVKGLSGPLFNTWLNNTIEDSSVRATVLSLSGQCNAFGQFVGGPIVGVIGTAYSIRAAITASGLTLSPVLLVYGWIMRHTRERSVGLEESALAESRM